MIIERDIIDEYKSGTSIKNTAKKYNTSSYAVKKILINNNIRIRTQSECVRKYSINEEYFDEIDTSIKICKCDLIKCYALETGSN